MGIRCIDKFTTSVMMEACFLLMLTFSMISKSIGQRMKTMSGNKTLIFIRPILLHLLVAVRILVLLVHRKINGMYGIHLAVKEETNMDREILDFMLLKVQDFALFQVPHR